MPPLVSLSSSDPQQEAHEERIQRLEERHVEISSTLAENTVRLQGLTKAVEDGLQSVVATIEKAVDPITAKVVEMTGKLDDHGRKLEALEEQETKRKARFDSGKKAVIWAVVAVGGATLTQVGQYLWRLIHP